MPQDQGNAVFMEDFHVGQVFSSGTVTVAAEEIVTFAKRFDPQDFHTDPEKAKQTIFGAHVASGWHTAGMTMRLMLDAMPRINGGVIGRSIENLSWPRAVRAGDVLSAEVEVLDIRPSKSDPLRGIARIRTTTRNQDAETVQAMESVIFLPRRPA